MTKMMAVWTAAMAVLASAGLLAAHHSLANFDTSAPVWVTGTVVRVERINPHSRIYLEQQAEHGQVESWIVDGPAAAQLNRIRFGTGALSAGDVIEVCGFEALGSQQAFRDWSVDASTPRPERFINGNLLVMPDGDKRVWSNYGQLYQCLGPDDQDLLTR